MYMCSSFFRICVLHLIIQTRTHLVLVSNTRTKFHKYKNPLFRQESSPFNPFNKQFLISNFNFNKQFQSPISISNFSSPLAISKSNCRIRKVQIRNNDDHRCAEKKMQFTKVRPSRATSLSPPLSASRDLSVATLSALSPVPSRHRVELEGPPIASCQPVAAPLRQSRPVSLCPSPPSRRRPPVNGAAPGGFRLIRLPIGPRSLGPSGKTTTSGGSRCGSSVRSESSGRQSPVVGEGAAEWVMVSSGRQWSPGIGWAAAVVCKCIYRA